MYSVTSCSGLIADDPRRCASSPNSSGALDVFGERMRAILVGVRNRRQAISQAIMFTSSLLVSATIMSASAPPAALEHAGIRGVARHGADVEAVLQVAQDLVVRVDDGDFVGLLAGQVVRGRAADLAGAEDDDLHRGIVALDDFQVGVGQHQPLGALALEVHLHPGVGPGLRGSGRRRRRTCRGARAGRAAGCPANRRRRPASAHRSGLARRPARHIGRPRDLDPRPHFLDAARPASRR